MKISTKTRYGLRAMIQLAKNYDEPLMSISQIAKDQNISQKYLENILLLLKKAKLLKSIRGSKGGYKLALPPNEITSDQIILALEDIPLIIECAESPNSCNKSDFCESHVLWKNINNSILNILKNTKLSDMIKGE